jgi:hypothetical protein
MREDQKKARANFNDEMRRRIDMIAADYSVPESEVAKVRGRLKYYDLLCFAKKCSISLDWLICGEVKGLIRTIVARRT